MPEVMTESPAAVMPDRLSNLWQDIYSELTDSGFIFKPIEEEFSSRAGKSNTQLKSFSATDSSNEYTLRCALIYSPKVEIINLMIYPQDAAKVPVFATEIICFGQIPRVAVIDLQPVQGSGELSEKVNREIKSTYDRYQPKLKHGGNLPLWVKAHFTPYCIYSRPESAEEWPALTTALVSYLRIWLTEFTPLSSGASSNTTLLQEYKKHHVDNTPGRPYLSSIFGREWSEKYFRNFMYPV